MEREKQKNRMMLVVAIVLAVLAVIVAVVAAINRNQSDSGSGAPVITDDVEVEDNTPYLDFENISLLNEYINQANISSVTVPLYRLLLSADEMAAKTRDNNWTLPDGSENSPNAYYVILDANEIQNTDDYGEQYKVRVNLSDGRAYELYFMGDKISGTLYNGLLVHRVEPASDGAYLYVNFLATEGYDAGDATRMLIEWGKSVHDGELIVNTINQYHSEQ